MKNVFLEISQNLQENKHMYRSLFFDKVADLDLFSCEFCEIFKNNVFYRPPSEDCFYKSYLFKVQNQLSR